MPKIKDILQHGFRKAMAIDEGAQLLDKLDMPRQVKAQADALGPDAFALFENDIPQFTNEDRVRLSASLQRAGAGRVFDDQLDSLRARAFAELLPKLQSPAQGINAVNRLDVSPNRAGAVGVYDRWAENDPMRFREPAADALAASRMADADNKSLKTDLLRRSSDAFANNPAIMGDLAAGNTINKPPKTIKVVGIKGGQRLLEQIPNPDGGGFIYREIQDVDGHFRAPAFSPGRQPWRGTLAEAWNHSLKEARQELSKGVGRNRPVDESLVQERTLSIYRDRIGNPQAERYVYPAARSAGSTPEPSAPASGESPSGYEIGQEIDLNGVRWRVTRFDENGQPRVERLQ